ncbi:MAG: hypothetical protein O2897_04680, partial [bacterium]|nr:hypothetical protein [bacterium]
KPDYQIITQSYTQNFASLYEKAELLYCVDPTPNNIPNINKLVFLPSNINNDGFYTPSSSTPLTSSDVAVLWRYWSGEKTTMISYSLSCNEAADYYSSIVDKTPVSRSKYHPAEPNNGPLVGMPLATVAVIPVPLTNYQVPAIQ